MFGCPIFRALCEGRATPNSLQALREATYLALVSALGG